jgi:subtilisin family serine protease
MRFITHIPCLSILLTGMLLCLQPLNAEKYCFRIYLNDKGAETAQQYHNPLSFLSPDAVERRKQQNVPIDYTDLPISRSCMDTLASFGTRIVAKSKWFSTVVVECNDSLVANEISKLAIVDSIKFVWSGIRFPLPVRQIETDTLKPSIDPLAGSIYGYAEKQISMLNGIPLHERGYRGQGMKVAVIDAGFKDAFRISAFHSMNLAGTYNVVHPGKSVYTDDEHGVKVLSCLAADLPGIMVGTAPDATYWLIKTEDNLSEYPIEEDYWVAALEYADSVGASVVSSSLGYHRFDDEELNYTTAMLDGRTAFITKAADKAADKGLLLFISAGNEGNDDEWERITFPADARNVLTVGSITEEMQRSTFSSWGYTADGRVKPDVVALGTGCTVINGEGDIAFSSGTSFSTPTVAGLAVCLWQALPELSNIEIMNLIRKNSSHYANPDKESGYGLPDFNKAIMQYK